ncbi:MAG: zinc-dependent metalloprotease [Bacteroidota bacterium]|nr:zinc-dependent metalloprotease [Bacteroidota bacterium]
MKIFFCFLFILPLFISAQKLPSIEQRTKGMQKQEGFFNFYWDEENGKIFLEINKLDSEILYQTSLPAGLGSNDIGLDRGLPGETRIVKFIKVGRKILMMQPNYTYRAITNDANERRAVEQSFAQSTLWAFTEKAENNNAVLVDATDFLLRDAMHIPQTLKKNMQGTYALDTSRRVMYLERTKNFPLNTEFEASLTFVNNDDAPGPLVSSVAPSSEAITLRVHHSFVQLPDNNFEKREFDPRSSFENISYFDYSTPVSEPIVKYFACRHRLKKKDPNAAMSEPVQPIVYYVDNGVPEPIRSALLEGTSWWNQAFEAAGYINAFRVKLLPDDADPMDIRYNVINWVHRSTRGWSYGSSIVDPRTGEIIKGVVSLGSLRVRQDYLIATGLLAPYANGKPADDKMLKMALARIRQLAAHEVGHTLGLMHNYSASTVSRSSVMDYPAPVASINAAGNIDLSNAYDDKIGAWDKVSIAWGYQDFPPGTNESEALNNQLNDAFKSGLRFLTDQDARPAGGMSPYAHLWDNGSNVFDQLKNDMKVRAKALEQFGENDIRPGMPMAMLEDVLVPVYFYHRYQLEAVTKLVGGMDYNYALRGDGQFTTKPISREMQLKALDAIMDCLDPKFLLLPYKIVSIIPPRPAGYISSRELFNKRTGLAFDALSPAETAADLPLSFLFNTERDSRMEQDVAVGGLSFNEMLGYLISHTWKASRRTGMEQLIQQQTEQVLLTYMLSLSMNNKASFQVQADTKKALSDLKAYIEPGLKVSKDASYTAHLILALDRMKEPKDAKPTVHEEIPPGSPIGCDME